MPKPPGLPSTRPMTNCPLSRVRRARAWAGRGACSSKPQWGQGLAAPLSAKQRGRGGRGLGLRSCCFVPWQGTGCAGGSRPRQRDAMGGAMTRRSGVYCVASTAAPKYRQHQPMLGAVRTRHTGQEREPLGAPASCRQLGSPASRRGYDAGLAKPRLLDSAYGTCQVSGATRPKGRASGCSMFP